MELSGRALIGIELSEFTRRSRSLLLHHSDLALERPLAPGEPIVLWDAVAGSYHAGSVVDAHSSDGDIDYRITVGVRLPESLALDRITGLPTNSAELGTREVFALLQKLREQTRTSGGLALDH